jgi:hypothetical protein
MCKKTFEPGSQTLRGQASLIWIPNMVVWATSVGKLRAPMPIRLSDGASIIRQKEVSRAVVTELGEVSLSHISHLGQGLRPRKEEEKGPQN